MATTVLNSWRSWAQPLSLTSTKPSRESMISRDVAGQQDGKLHPTDNLLGTFHDSSTKTIHAMVPSAPSGNVPQFHTCATNGNASFSQQASGGANANPPPSPPSQSTSNIPLPTQNQHPFPSPRPLPPPPDSSPMLSLLPVNPLRRPHKLRKNNPTSTMPPVLAPLSFIEEPDLDLDFEHISHDVQHPSIRLPHASLMPESFNQQDVPQPGLCETLQNPPSLARRLTKRRRPSLPPIPQAQIVPSSSGAAAAAAVSGNPSAPIAAISQISSPISPGTSHRARSDVGHGVRSSLSIKRSSIIRRLSVRSPKRSLDAIQQGRSTNPVPSGSTGHATSGWSSGSMGRWSKWRSAASDLGHGVEEETPIFLPLVRVTSPLSIKLPSYRNSEDIAPPVPVPPVKTDLNDSRPDSLTPSDPEEASSPISIDPNYPHLRAKFTLEGNESESELSNPPSGSITPATPFTPHNYSAPLSQTLSAYNSQFLSPLSRHESGDSPARRRWTFAAAMTDDDITDEVLVEELERMRLRHGWSGGVDDVCEAWDAEHVLFGSQNLTDSPQEEALQRDQLEIEHDRRDPQLADGLSHTRSLPSFPPQRRNSTPTPGTGSIRHWETARKVLLTCRELVRTERHYLASLYALLSSETETAPPPLMLRYAEELVKVSEMYLARLEKNPSASGVAASFVDAEEAIGGAYVGWCGVVGMWFSDDQQEAKMKVVNTSSTNSLSRMTKLSKPGKPKVGGEYQKEKEKTDKGKEREREDDKMALDPPKSTRSWRRSMTSIADLTASLPSAKKRGKSMAPPPSFPVNGFGQRRRNGSIKKPLVRDLAILPTQRVMRYVLLYRDLLTHTPSTSPSQPLLKRAADAALRIAQKCDRAQNNSAFILDGKGPVPSNTSFSSPSHGDTNPASSIPKERVGTS